MENIKLPAMDIDEAQRVFERHKLDQASTQAKGVKGTTLQISTLTLEKMNFLEALSGDYSQANLNRDGTESYKRNHDGFLNLVFDFFAEVLIRQREVERNNADALKKAEVAPEPSSGAGLQFDGGSV
jgi:hypothetical protein